MTAAVLLAIVLIPSGILAYRGRWKWWVLRGRGFGSYIGFSCLYFGCAGLTASLSILLGVPTPVGVVLAVIAAVSLLVGLISLWWLPRFALPAWFRALGDRSLVIVERQ